MERYHNPIPEIEDQKKYESSSKCENDYKEIKPVYFAFIDILGFKKTFDDNRNSEGTEFTNGYKAVFNYYFDLIDASYLIKTDDKKNYAGQTSDSLYFYTSRADHLLEFIKIFSHLNMFAMSKNVFFRGGIAKGTLFRKEDYQFYGDSVIYAYLIESVIAKNPVIYIDKSTYADLKQSNSLDCNLLFEDKNERYYIKPFIWLQEEKSINLNSILRDSVEIKEIDKNDIIKVLENNLRVFEYDGKNYDKYVFLINELKPQPGK